MKSRTIHWDKQYNHPSDDKELIKEHLSDAIEQIDLKASVDGYTVLWSTFKITVEVGEDVISEHFLTTDVVNNYYTVRDVRADALAVKGSIG